MPTITKRGRARVISFEDLRDDIIGLDVYNRGKLRLDKWQTQLPLAALSQGILDYIALHGGGEVADAENYYSASAGVTIASGGDTVVTATPTSYKLRGFYVYGTGDGTATLTFTPAGGAAVVVKVSVHNVERQQIHQFPNPIVLAGSVAVTLYVDNTTAGSQTYWGAILGE